MFVFLWILVLNFSAEAVFAQELRDIKPPVAPPGSKLFWLLWTAVLLAAGFLFWKFYWERRLRKPEPAASKSVAEAALERLDSLQGRNLPARGELKRFYSELSDIIRRYMEDRFNIKAPEMTTQEFLNYLQNSPALSEDHKALLSIFLTSCDLVKFAKFQATIEETENSLRLARQLVEETQTT